MALYVIEDEQCSRTRHSDECVDGPKCEGCIGRARRLILDERRRVVRTHVNVGSKKRPDWQAAYLPFKEG